MGKVNISTKTDKDTSTYVIIPRYMLGELEEARKELYNQFPNPKDIPRLNQVTAIMWKLANRRWPALSAIVSGEPNNEGRT